jgi:hypothetical protein
LRFLLELKKCVISVFLVLLEFFEVVEFGVAGEFPGVRAWALMQA